MRTIVMGTFALGLSVGAGCGGDNTGGDGGKKSARRLPDASFDVTAEKSALAESWIVKAAQDPAGLDAIGGASAGWPLLMQNDTLKALEAFEGDLKSKADDVDLKIGAARSALELAHAHMRLADIVYRASPKVLKAQMALPGAAAGSAWADFIKVRMHQYGAQMGFKQTGEVPTSTAPEGSPVVPWSAALKADAVGPLPDLLAGRAGGADADIPPGSEKVYGERLRLRSLVAAGRLKEARKRLARINQATPDVRIELEKQNLVFLDPHGLLAQGHVYAAVAEEHLKGVAGASQLLLAEAQLLQGKGAEAAKSAEAAAGFAGELPLSLVIFSGISTFDDFKAEAIALQAMALDQAGQRDAAKAAAEQIGQSSIAQKVSRVRTLVRFGQPLEKDVFPTDRSQLERLVREAIPKDAPGQQVVADLLLIDRYVDVVQRRFADALSRTGKRAVATRVRADAEEKSKSQAPSRRNTLSALTASALDNVDIGQPRVAVKYLNRMRDHLPAVLTPMEMLRDLLTIRAINHGGGVKRGN
ncbi:MAG: hypothetical protein ACE366_27305 [Bradymonadia bacterium]